MAATRGTRRATGTSGPGYTVPGMKPGAAGELTQDLLVGQAGQLEQFRWFVRAHLESADGTLVTVGARTEKTAAERARR